MLKLIEFGHNHHHFVVKMAAKFNRRGVWVKNGFKEDTA